MSLPGTLPTTILAPERLRSALGQDLLLVSELGQHTGSFKYRAALHLARSVPHRRIIAASSGNFGQALALACAQLGKQCTIVMPQTSAKVKIEAVRNFGGCVDLIDTQVVSRAARVAALAAADREAYTANAYDDPLIIAGNSSLGEEIAPLDLDAVLVPVGGGGLSSGIVEGLRRAGKHTRVFGAEPQLANDAARSLRAGRILANEGEPATIADGARTVSLGKHNWAILEDGLAGIVEVPEAAIKDALRLLYRLAEVKAEPTGALSLGALLTRPDLFRGKRIGCVVSGGNVDPEVFERIIHEKA